MPPESQPLLTIDKLSIKFGDKQVVHQLSYTLAPNRILGIVGESGSGKSVSSLALMGLLPKSASITGRAILHSASEDTSLLGLDDKSYENIRGNRIAMIFQEPMTSLNPLIRCGKQILESLELHDPTRATRAEVEALLQKVHIPSPTEAYDKYPHQLSGGQKQRVMIAMALACKPEILIADEPTTALDVTVQKEIIALLRELVDEQTSMIFISHDLGLVSDISDEILVMYQGNKIEQGTAQQIVQNPKESYTKALLACRPSKNYALEHLPTLADFSGDKELDTPQPKTTLPQGDTLLRVEDLNVHFPIQQSSKAFYHALDDVSFYIKKGECLGIVGESGSGKSTIANALVGLVHPSSGSMTMDGEEIDYRHRKAAQALRKKMQIVFQDPYSSLNPKLKIGSAITEVLKLHRNDLRTKADRQAEVASLLQQVDLKAEDADKYPHEFSGGQRQRVVIARSLAVRPELLICDESVSALDVSVQAQILNLLRSLQKNTGISMLFISHDLSVIRFLCQRVLVLRQGKVVESSETENLFADPLTAYTRELIEDIPGKKYLAGV